MMKGFLSAFFFLTLWIGHSQGNTEVYLFDLDSKKGSYLLSNPKNISNNHGYDNQPSFWNDDVVLFSSTRAGQTDIKRFSVTEGSTSRWITNTPTGSEYSPTRIPKSNNISSIRLDLDGLQRLYEYDSKSGESEALSDLKIGYHVWHNDHTLVATVLVKNQMDLVVIDFDEGTQITVDENVGRSLHNIPRTNTVSYIKNPSAKGDSWKVMALNPISKEKTNLIKVEFPLNDMAWLPNGSILTPMKNKIAMFHPEKDSTWQNFHEFNKDQVFNISRIAVNASGTRLALVTDVSPKEIVQRQVNTFNRRNLNDFVSNYSENILARRFPNDTMYLGKEKMLESYERFFSNTKDTKVEVVKRIAIGNKVIDEEITLVDSRNGHQVALYEVENGLIQTMSFIFPNQETSDAESIVTEQLKAYNARDIDAFMETYTENIKLYNFPNNQFAEGKEKMREQYNTFFQNTKDLNCEIKNRIVIGNKVIDEEYITANGSNFSAVAVYEVENGKISKVTFLR